MRRIKMIMGIAAVLVGMLALNAGPAMADELDGFFIEEDSSGHDGLVVDEGTTTLDELCSPGLPDGIFIPGCIFSDSIEADDADENDDSSHENDSSDDNDENDNSRNGN